MKRGVFPTVAVPNPARNAQSTPAIMAVRAVVAAGLLWLAGAAAPAFAQTQFQYSTTTTGAITDNNCGGATSGQIVRTFTVPTSYIVGDVNLGVRLTHTYRSDVRIFLTSPLGTTVTVMTWTGNVQSGDNLHDLFDDEAAAAITTHNATVTDPTTASPPYSHSFQPSSPLSAFDGQNAAGTWTLRICDAVGADTGTFQRADLYITSTSLTVAKSSTVVSDPENGTTNPKITPGAVVRYCILVTNAGLTGTAPATAVTMSDAVPAGMTYVAGSLTSGTTCATATTAEDDDAAGADETDPFGMSISGTTVTGTAASLAPGATMALAFRVTVN